jgi:hypothetical protein
MSEEHLDLLSFATGDGVGIGSCDCAGLVASGFMNGERDLACRRVRPALLSEGLSSLESPLGIFPLRDRNVGRGNLILARAFRLPSFLLVERDRADDDEPLYQFLIP